MTPCRDHAAGFSTVRDAVHFTGLLLPIQDHDEVEDEEINERLGSPTEECRSQILAWAFVEAWVGTGKAFP